mmetsp:Transcript_61554/g.200871  ORF Transcript_61554/g.200871 Transcript_61554/m.200871 type:complete len:330 (-) Transcript_61554:415-1404(-)
MDFSDDGSKPEFNVATIEVLEARNLVASDIGFFRAGKSDAYVIVKDVKGMVGDDRRTSVVNASLNPTWNQTFHCKFNYKLSAFKFKLMDKDVVTEDDPLGKATVPIDWFLDKLDPANPIVMLDLWLPLAKAKHGELHVRITVQFNIPIALPGIKVPLPMDFQIGLAWDFKKKETPIDLDASIAGLDRGENIYDKVFFGHLVGFNGAVRHSGDDRTGDGDGDDETITFDMSRLPAQVEKIVVTVNSFSGQPLSHMKYAYVRIIDRGRTHAFFGIGKGHVPETDGLLFGVVQRSAEGHGWDFVTTAVNAPGRDVASSLPHIVGYGRAHLGW